MFKRRGIAVCVLSALFMSSCGKPTTPREASKANFEKTIQHYFDQKGTGFICVDISYTHDAFPIFIQRDVMYERNQIRRMDVFVQAGLIRRTESEMQVNVKPQWGGISEKMKSVSAYRYDLNEEGRKYYKSVKSTDEKKGVSQFCFGQIKKVKIVSFSKPKDMADAKVSEVIYKYNLEGVPEWAKKAEFLKEFSSVGLDFYTQAGKANLIQRITDIGWIVGENKTGANFAVPN